MDLTRQAMQNSTRRVLVASSAALAVGLLVVAAVSHVHRQGPIEDEATTLSAAQAAVPDGKFYLMKMIRRQVAMKQREAKEKKVPLKVHLLRSYKQVMAAKSAHLGGDKTKLKALAAAKLRKAKVLLEREARLHSAGDASKPVELLQGESAAPVELQQQAPPNYQFTPLQTVPQYQASQSMRPQQGYAPAPQYGQGPPQGGGAPIYPPQQQMAQQPEQSGYPPQQQQGMYPQQQQQPQQPMMQQQMPPEQEPGYPPPQEPGYPLPQQGFPPPQPGYPPQENMFPPPQPMQEQMPPPQAPQEGQEEASHTDCVPLFYYINSDLRDHFYSTNFKELEGGKLHYAFLGVMTGVYATYKSGTVPVYRYYNNFDHDHVYTTNYHKWGKGGSYRTPDGEHGYTYEGVAFYIYKYPRAGLNPIYAFVNPKNGNKIFSMSNSQAGPHSDNFKLQGVIGYGGCTPSKNDGMQLSAPGGGDGSGGGGPPAMGGGPGGGGPPQSGSPIKMPGGGPPDDNVGLMDLPKI